MQKRFIFISIIILLLAGIVIISLLLHKKNIKDDKREIIKEVLEFDINEYGECVYSYDYSTENEDDVIFRIFKISKREEFNEKLDSVFGTQKDLDAIPNYRFINQVFYEKMDDKDIDMIYTKCISGKYAKTKIFTIYVVYDGDDEYLFICG